MAALETALTRRRFFDLLARPIKHLGSSPRAQRDAPAALPGASRSLELRADLCLAWGDMACVVCYGACPRRDAALVLDGQRPRLVLERCDGCGVCVAACATVNDRRALSWRTSGRRASS